ncbi:Alpha/Beta hydrolase protein [Lasiosphaeris hirsuta]|uniref:Alpha/Beta hydrolase protein n=1 Tax=Lasiosphaeris hirsuta TaxID=260670 RepID=A0AA40DWN2_9PEZI|nr:Alpha/Beta hydrolase protein [Lasiosphaeris hirsuta]
MAAKQYHIGDALLKKAVHHESFEKLWETKWRAPCKMGLYPFMFGCIQDFEPIAQAIIKKGLAEPYNWDEYALMFFPKAEELLSIAMTAETAGEKEKASEYYLRASAVFRIARFPAIRTEQQRKAWRRNKDAFYRGAALMEQPIREVLIPHTHALDSEGTVIPVNYLLPPGASAQNPHPLVLIFCGLDGLRTDLAVWQRGWLEKHVATVVVEIPGTGDSPARAADPTSPDRQWSSMLDWLDSQPEIDSTKIIVLGLSTGGYYALRIAHTHSGRLLGSVSQGGGCHHMFDRAWLERVNELEFVFDEADSLAWKWGYSDLELFMREAGKFSLVNDGTLDKKTNVQILLVNGKEDEIFPIEDLYVAIEHGSPKLSRVITDRKHMGEPEASFVILEWIHNLLGLDGDIAAQIHLIPSKMKY